MEELDVSDIDQEEDSGAGGKADALGQLQEERKALDASRKLLDELLSRSQEEAVAKAAAGNSSHPTSVTFGNSNSGFQAGIINGAVSGINFGGK